MEISFTPNPEPTIGIEMELHLVDATTGELVSAASSLLSELGEGHPGGSHPRAKHELFESTIEIITGVCRTPKEARADLAETLAEVRAAATRHGLTIMSSGTHPYGRTSDQAISPSQRYRDLVNEMQWTARRLLICGTHVHVGVRSGERAIAIFNELQRTLPLFLILASSSPYFESEDTGLASSRSKVFESLPTAGLPPVVRDWGDFESFMETLLAAECIRSVREVWWDIRPHPDLGTVELRMCDAVPTLRETIAIAALAQSLVAHIDALSDAGEIPEPPREWSVQANRWLAARHGVDAELIVDEHGGRRPAGELLEELVDQLRPTAAKLDADKELEDVLELWRLGPGYLRQRRIIEAGGSLRDVVASLVRELEEDAPGSA